MISRENKGPIKAAQKDAADKSAYFHRLRTEEAESPALKAKLMSVCRIYNMLERELADVRFQIHTEKRFYGDKETRQCISHVGCADPAACDEMPKPLCVLSREQFEAHARDVEDEAREVIEAREILKDQRA